MSALYTPRVQHVAAINDPSLQRREDADCPEHKEKAREMLNTDESKHIQEIRRFLMNMELDELKTFVLAKIKEKQLDVELPSGGKDEIVAWAIE